MARFIEDINIKYGILLNYTQLEVSEVHHWVETFQISTIPGNQPGPQQPQVPQVAATKPHSELPHHPLPSVVEQQAEIDRLTYVAQQWAIEEPHRVSEGPTCYSKIGRGRSTCHHSTPNMSPVSQHHHHHRQYDRQGQHMYNHYDQRSQHISRQEQDKRMHSNNLQTQILIQQW